MNDPGTQGATLYVRSDCPLCFSLKRSAARAARRHRVPLRIVDIRGEADLLARYDSEVPVLLLPGVSTPLQGRVPAAQVDAAFLRAARRAGSAGSDRGPGPRGPLARLFALLGGRTRRRGR